MSPLPWSLLPETAEASDDGRLRIGGVDVGDLADRYGTPLFVYDEAHLRARVREAVAAFPGGVHYAAKAFLCGAMAQLVAEEGGGLDVASGGEMALALRAGVSADRLVLHGNNKSTEELSEALDAGIHRIVVDSFDEIARIAALVAAGRPKPKVLIRVTPGVSAHTHEYIATGQVDSKFGFGLQNGDADRAVTQLQRPDSPAELVGLHIHIGSQIFVADSFARAVDAIAPFVNRHGLAGVVHRRGHGRRLRRGRGDRRNPGLGRASPQSGRGGRRDRCKCPPNRAAPSPPRRRSPSIRSARSRTSPACGPTSPSTAG